jgi:glycine cleavage system H protein
MVAIPTDRSYSESHLWIQATPQPSVTVRIGLTAYAQAELGEVVSVYLPAVTSALVIGAEFGELESAKVVSDLIAPVSGTVVAINDRLSADPTVINRDPYGDGWLLEVELNPESPQGSLTAAQYAAVVSEAEAGA